MENKKGIKETILSLSLVTVMAGTAVSPALGEISTYFSNINPILIKMILTVPAIFIILTNLIFQKISENLGTKHIALIGLALYVIGGVGGGMTNNIYILLIFRAILGIGVGFIMPLSTGLFSYYFIAEEQEQFIGYSSAMNSLGGIIAMNLSGYLVSISWRYSFLVYLLGIFAFILILIFLPNTKMDAEKNKFSLANINKNKFYYFSMFLTMVIFYIFTTNFSMISTKENLFDVKYMGILMSVQTLFSFACGIKFAKIKNKLKNKTTFLGGLTFLLGYTILATQSSIFFIVISLALIGVGLGILMPYLNKTLLLKTPKSDATSTMALMSASLYLGQFLSPLISQSLNNIIDSNLIRFPYYLGIFISIILLGTLFLNNNSQKN